MDYFSVGVGPGGVLGCGDVGQNELQRHEEFRERGGKVRETNEGVCGPESKAAEVGEVFSAGFCGVLLYQRIAYPPETMGGIGVPNMISFTPSSIRFGMGSQLPAGGSSVRNFSSTCCRHQYVRR